MSLAKHLNSFCVCQAQSLDINLKSGYSIKTIFLDAMILPLAINE